MQNINKNRLIVFTIALILLAILVGLFIWNRTNIVVEPPENQNGPVNNEISWDEAVQLIQDCEVTAVFQSHSLSVELTLKDGTSRIATEPTIDLVFTEATRASEKCGFDILIATE